MVGDRIRRFAGPDPRLDEDVFAGGQYESDGARHSFDARTIVPRHTARAQLSLDRIKADAEANHQPVYLCTAADRADVAQTEEMYRYWANVANTGRTGRLPGVLPLRVGHRYVLRSIVNKKRCLVPGTELELVDIWWRAELHDVTRDTSIHAIYICT